MSDQYLNAQLQHAAQVQARYAEALLRKPHVVGLGVGYATRHGERTPEVALVVMVDKKLPPDQLDDDARIPAQLDGVRVDVQEMGGFAAFQAG